MQTQSNGISCNLRKHTLKIGCYNIIIYAETCFQSTYFIAIALATVEIHANKRLFSSLVERKKKLFLNERKEE